MTAGDLNKGKRIGFAGCRVTTRDAMSNLLEQGYRIDQLITVSRRAASERYHISGYEDLSEFASDHDISVHHVEDYRLRDSAADQRAITAMGLDLLVVLGWQRIVPKWFLDVLPIGAIGMHGGPEPPPYGRGHSVMNWSLIEGRSRFLCYLFFYRVTVDSGPLIGIQEFDINPWDTCETLHFKYQLSMGRILTEHLPGILAGKQKGEPQASHGATYYPKRSPEDGRIAWNQRAREVHDLVRGVTRPYPGAFTSLDGGRLVVWSGQPFDSKLTWNREPGTIVEVFYNGKAVVQTRDYGFLLDDYEGLKLGKSDVGRILGDG